MLSKTLSNTLSGTLSRTLSDSVTASYDPDALAYVNALVSSDGVTLSSYAPESDLFKGLKADGIFTKIKAALLSGYGTSASLLRELIALDAGTVPGGTATALSGRVSFTSNGSIRFPKNLEQYISSINSHGWIYDYYDNPNTATIYDCGVYNGVGAIIACLRVTDTWGGRYGTFDTFINANAAGVTSGVMMSQRTSSTDAAMYHWDGTTFSTKATNAAMSGGALTSGIKPSYGALNNNGTEATHGNNRYRSIWITSGMSSAELQLFCARYQAFKIARGWI